MFSAAFHFIIIWPQYFSLLLKSYFHFHPKMTLSCIFTTWLTVLELVFIAKFGKILVLEYDIH